MRNKYYKDTRYSNDGRKYLDKRKLPKGLDGTNWLPRMVTRILAVGRGRV